MPPIVEQQEPYLMNYNSFLITWLTREVAELCISGSSLENKEIMWTIDSIIKSDSDSIFAKFKWLIFAMYLSIQNLSRKRQFLILMYNDVCLDQVRFRICLDQVMWNCTYNIMFLLGHHSERKNFNKSVCICPPQPPTSRQIY